MKSYWGIANFVSLGNAACGILSIFQALEGHFDRAVSFLLAAVVFDFLDGKTARLLGQATLFGKGLDCLSDVISFGVAPATLGFLLVKEPHSALQTILTIFVLAGAWRLSYFYQWKGPARPPGMPITVNGLLFPLLYYAHASALFFILFFGLSTVVMVLPIFLSRPSIS